MPEIKDVKSALVMTEKSIAVGLLNFSETPKVQKSLHQRLIIVMLSLRFIYLCLHPICMSYMKMSVLLNVIQGKDYKPLY